MEWWWWRPKTKTNGPKTMGQFQDPTKWECLKENEEEVSEVVIAKNFPKLMMNTKAQIHETQKTSINTEKLTSRHILSVRPNTN